ncbi:unnamed protein product [Caenorhabditis bovis]|uniref:Uncharacterized protein n=1 Tax=Caenorhabditis bovis TaxID=2654633 RepID=A0A8S1ETQ9_9PELO|nr:unnamed protein product [Caenorhabditis bovis]
MKNSSNLHEAAEAIVERIETELRKYKKSQYLRFATIMDPRYKMTFLDQETKEEFIEYISLKYSTHNSLSDDCAILEKEQPPAKKQKSSFEAFIQVRMAL